MMDNQNYIYKKEVDWSLLKDGFTIPVSIQIQFLRSLKNPLIKGDKRNIKIIIENQFYDATLINQNFDANKYPTHKELLQIRYSPNSEISKAFRNIFFKSSNYLRLKKEEQIKKKIQVKTPAGIKEYLAIYSTEDENIFYAECITHADITVSKELFRNFKIDEYFYETNFNKIDETATIVQKQRISKIRKLDVSISDNLKFLYNYNCQICDNNFGNKYNSTIAEGHHLDSFTLTMNNNSDNIMVICPNHHRVIHKVKPEFDRKDLCFTYANGLKESLKLNHHL